MRYNEEWEVVATNKRTEEVLSTDKTQALEQAKSNLRALVNGKYCSAKVMIESFQYDLLTYVLGRSKPAILRCLRALEVAWS